MKSCTMLAVQADGSSVTTIEGMTPDGEVLHPLQQAFWEKHGLQCGFCTPGHDHGRGRPARAERRPDRRRDPSRARGQLSAAAPGYQNIVAAIREAASTMQAGAAAPSGAQA